MRRKRLRVDSGGPGTFRGGLGQEIELELDTDTAARLSLLSDRHDNPAGGILGGLAGGPSVITFGDGTKPHPKSRTSIQPRQSVLLLYAGGGGYGDPRKRSRESVLSDLRHGYISAAAARSIYGVE